MAIDHAPEAPHMHLLEGIDLTDSESEVLDTVQEGLSEKELDRITKLALRDVIVMRRGFEPSFGSAETNRLIRERRAQRDAGRS